MQTEYGLKIEPGFVIPFSEIEFTYTHSSGAGGQNVNKVATKAVLRWNPARSNVLPRGVRERFFARYAKKLTVDGDVVLTSQKSRSQAQNANDCLQKLKEIILEVWHP